MVPIRAAMERPLEPAGRKAQGIASQACLNGPREGPEAGRVTVIRMLLA